MTPEKKTASNFVKLQCGTDEILDSVKIKVPFLFKIKNYEKVFIVE